VAFELPTTSEAVHAGGNDRSPLVGFLVNNDKPQSRFARLWLDL